MKIPVLMYHAVQSDSNIPVGIEEQGKRIYILTQEQLELQMRYLFDRQYYSVYIEELNCRQIRDRNRVVITFDDGSRSDYTIALPIIKKYGFKAYFFITIGWIGKSGYLNEVEIRRLIENGMVIGSHGVTHDYLEDLCDEKVRSEMLESKNRLEQITGIPVDCFSAPGGRIRPHHYDMAFQIGYQAVFTSAVKAFDPFGNRNAIPRIAIKRDDTLADFQKIVSMDYKYFIKAMLLKKVLNAGKAALGNRGYEKLRNSVLKIFR